MSLLMNSLRPSATGSLGLRSEQRPRFLQQPNSFPDSEQDRRGQAGRDAASPKSPKPYTRPHGNAKPQEPIFHQTWTLDRNKPRLVQHPHPKPWSLSCCPGKKESPEGENCFHRVWMELGPRGRWNKARKLEFYSKQDSNLNSLCPQDDIAARTAPSVHKLWTHLVDEGLRPGGHEKVDYRHHGPNTNLNHFYVGKYENIAPCQKMLSTGQKDPRTEERRDWKKDKRPAFDNRLHDDAIRTSDEARREDVRASFDLHRPLNSLSCPQLGADFVARGW